eukprot:79703-Hanusia_phi.AAC.1
MLLLPAAEEKQEAAADARLSSSSSSSPHRPSGSDESLQGTETKSPTLCPPAHPQEPPAKGDQAGERGKAGGDEHFLEGKGREEMGTGLEQAGEPGTGEGEGKETNASGIFIPS